MIEIECGHCHAKHYPPILGRSLVCCSTRTGVRRLITEYHDPATGRRWFTVMKKTIVRVITEPGTRAANEMGDAR